MLERAAVASLGLLLGVSLGLPDGLCFDRQTPDASAYGSHKVKMFN